MEFEDIWEELVKRMEPLKIDLNFAKSDCSLLGQINLCEQESIEEVPTIKLYQPLLNLKSEYTGPSDLKSLIDFLFNQLNIKLKME